MTAALFTLALLLQFLQFGTPIPPTPEPAMPMEHWNPHAAALHGDLIEETEEEPHFTLFHGTTDEDWGSAEGPDHGYYRIVHADSARGTIEEDGKEAIPILRVGGFPVYQGDEYDDSDIKSTGHPGDALDYAEIPHARMQRDGQRVDTLTEAEFASLTALRNAVKAKEKAIAKAHGVRDYDPGRPCWGGWRATECPAYRPSHAADEYRFEGRFLLINVPGEDGILWHHVSSF